MGKVEEYRRYAADCLEMANGFQEPLARAALKMRQGEPECTELAKEVPHLAGVVGHDFFKPYAVTFDFMNMQIFLQ
jgi:hypothetical protein